MPRCPRLGAHAWVVAIASHRRVLLSGGWLITVEAPGHPTHPPSTQLDAVVNIIYCTTRKLNEIFMIIIAILQRELFWF